MGAYNNELIAAGVMLDGGGLQPSAKAARVHKVRDQVTVTDGPFAETKELIDGFVLVNVESKQEALEMSREFMGVAGDGTGEILQVFDMGDDLPKR
jgi:hypothetical protein